MMSIEGRVYNAMHLILSVNNIDTYVIGPEAYKHTTTVLQMQDS